MSTMSTTSSDSGEEFQSPLKQSAVGGRTKSTKGTLKFDMLDLNPDAIFSTTEAQVEVKGRPISAARAAARLHTEEYWDDVKEKDEAAGKAKDDLVKAKKDLEEATKDFEKAKEETKKAEERIKDDEESNADLKKATEDMESAKQKVEEAKAKFEKAEKEEKTAQEEAEKAQKQKKALEEKQQADELEREKKVEEYKKKVELEKAKAEEEKKAEESRKKEEKEKKQAERKKEAKEQEKRDRIRNGENDYDVEKGFGKANQLYWKKRYFQIWTFILILVAAISTIGWIRLLNIHSVKLGGSGLELDGKSSAASNWKNDDYLALGAFMLIIFLY